MERIRFGGRPKLSSRKTGQRGASTHTHISLKFTVRAREREFISAAGRVTELRRAAPVTVLLRYRESREPTGL